MSTKEEINLKKQKRGDNPRSKYLIFMGKDLDKRKKGNPNH